jgi:hypothetical protein
MVGLMGLVLVCLAAWAQDTEATQATRAGAPVEAAKPPPPTIADLVLLLKSYPPDLEKIRRLRAELDSPIKDTTDAVELAREWHIKARVAQQLGDNDRRYEAKPSSRRWSTPRKPTPAAQWTRSGACSDSNPIRQD